MTRRTPLFHHTRSVSTPSLLLTLQSATSSACAICCFLPAAALKRVCAHHAQVEIDSNRVAVYLNIAAVCLATGRTGGAVHWCGRALAVEPDSGKARLRLAKAHLARHEHAVRLPLPLCALSGISCPAA